MPTAAEKERAMALGIAPDNIERESLLKLIATEEARQGAVEKGSAAPEATETTALAELTTWADEKLAAHAKELGIDTAAMSREEVIGAIYGAELEALKSE